MVYFLLKVCFEEIGNAYLSVSVSRVWFVRFIEVKCYLRAKFFVHFTKVSTLECPHYRGNIMWISPENSLGENFSLF